MKHISQTFSLAVLLSVGAAEDPYQSMGQAVGSIYKSIGSMVSASQYSPEDVLGAQQAASNAINSLRHQAATYDWNSLLGTSVASVYTSQLSMYMDGLSSVNSQIDSLAAEASQEIARSIAWAAAHPSTAPASQTVVETAKAAGNESLPTGASTSSVEQASTRKWGTQTDMTSQETSSNSETGSTSSSRSKQTRSASGPKTQTEATESGAKSGATSPASQKSSNLGVTTGINLGLIAAAVAALI